MRQRLRLCLTLRSVSPTLKCPDSKCKLSLMQTAKHWGRVLFPDGDGSWENPLIEAQKYWSPALRSALGAQQDGGFPYQLSLQQQNKPQPVPAIEFTENTGQSIADLFNKQVKIYVTPTGYFTTKFRQIFTQDADQVHTGKVREEVVGQA